jgi:hypothetical protein
MSHRIPSHAVFSRKNVSAGLFLLLNQVDAPPGSVTLSDASIVSNSKVIVRRARH